MMRFLMSTTTMTVLLPLMAQHLVSVDAFTSTSAHRGVKITSLCGECQQPELLSPFRRHSKTECATTALAMSGEPSSEGSKQQLPFYLDPNTKGGALVLMVVLFVVPYLAYQVMVSPTFGLGMDEIDAGITVGMGFTIVSMLAWVSTYIFRVATKDMTYAKQLKDYENAVIAKRLEELDEDEVRALVEEVEKDSF